MKIMWLCGTPIPQVAKTCNLSESIHEGWLNSVATELEKREDVEFVFVVLSKEANVGVNYHTNKNSSYITINLKNETEETLEKAFEEILRNVEPDVIHIWGTEYLRSWAMVAASKKAKMLERVVVSIQGLVSMIEKHYMGGIPGKYQIVPSFRDVIRKDTLRMQKKNMEQRGIYETNVLKTVQHVIGRTYWDKACAKLVNPEVNYHFNNETLRETFYDSGWEYKNCEKHRIFVAQSHYPIKGFHYLLEAVGILKERYHDINVYFSGHDNAFKSGILKTAYGQYVQWLIKRNHLENNIHYVGMLNAEQMKEQYLKAEIYVSPSVIENSPNSVGEAMILGVPVVSSNVGGVADMLVHEKEGFLYQADAPYMLAYYISTFFENQEKEAELGKAAKEHALKTHNKIDNITKLIEIYQEIIEER